MAQTYLKEVFSPSTGHKIYRCQDCSVHVFLASNHKEKDRMQVYDLSDTLIGEFQKRYRLWRTTLGDFATVKEFVNCLSQTELTEI